MSDRIELVCPCCDSKLVVDSTGEILSHEPKKMDAEKTFESAMGVVREGSKRREDAFTKAFDRTKRQDDLLEKKFEEARRKAKNDKSKGHNPMDFD